MAEVDELQDIKTLLAQIRDQGAVQPTTSVNANDVERYTQLLAIARSELSQLEEGTAAYARKQREVNGLQNQARNAIKDTKDEMGALQLATRGVAGAFDLATNAIDKIIVKAGEMVAAIMADAKQLDSLVISMQATTGASEKQASMIGTLTDRLILYGVSNQEAAAAVQGLYSQFTSFSQLSEEQQAEIGRTVSLMNELGVSVSASSQILESSTRTLGFTLGQTEELIMDMRASAVALQVPIEQLTRDFASAENMIAALGRTGPDTFKQLAAQSKATGVEMGTILGLVEKFDTFEGAATAVQGLNAVLGGNFLDSLSMVQEVDPARRFELIRDAIFAAGHSVESLADSNDYYLKKSLADVLGLGVSDFMKMLSGDIDELTGAVENASYSFEEMRKEAFGLKGFDDVVNNVMASFKRPISEVQKATRVVFEGLSPAVAIFEKLNARLIDSTNNFVRRNTKLVGAIGILYNLGNIDGIQKGYELFKGMATFTGSVLSNLFSIKGILLMLSAGALYMIKDNISDIYKTFHSKGAIAGIKEIIAALGKGINVMKDKLANLGFNKAFFSSLFNKIKSMANLALSYVNKEFLGPMFDRIQIEGTYQFERFFANISRSMKLATYKSLRGDGGTFGKALAYSADAMFGLTDAPEVRSRAEVAASYGNDNELARAAAFDKAQRENNRATMALHADSAKLFTTVNDSFAKIAPYIQKTTGFMEKTAKSFGNLANGFAKEFNKEVTPELVKGLAEIDKKQDIYINNVPLKGSQGRAGQTLIDFDRQVFLDGTSG